MDGLKELIFLILEQASVQGRNVWAVTLWSLWRSRNMKAWDNVDESSSDIVMRGHHALDE